VGAYHSWVQPTIELTGIPTLSPRFITGYPWLPSLSSAEAERFSKSVRSGSST